MNKDDWEIIKSITASEQHFNDLCFKIRTLASTWLLATLAGVGFLVSKTIAAELRVEQLIVFLCWVGSCGIVILWVLDLLVYQRFLAAWFDERKPIEERNSDFPQIRVKISVTQPGGKASNLIKIYYLCLMALPLLMAVYTCLYLGLSYGLLMASLVLLASFFIVIMRLTPGGRGRPASDDTGKQ